MSRAPRLPVHAALADLLAPGPGGDDVVSIGRGGRRTRAELASRAAAVAERVADAGGGTWLLHCEDSFAFAAGLFGIAHGGGEAALLPNRQEGTLERARVRAVGSVLDAKPPAAGPGGDVGGPCLDPLGLPESLLPLSRLRPDATFVHLSTSGTTGEGRSVAKALRHLADEVAVLERTFGAALGGQTCFFATASHQHLYGLLFRVLWPLASGRPFCADTYLHAEELVPRLCEVGDAALVSTPAHLRRASALSRARRACREVFSSGAPLDAETALRVRGDLDRAPVEVFGSTETGGVAWRRQEPGADGRWTPLSGVRLAVSEGRLAVASPFVSADPPEPARFVMGDLAEIGEDGCFALGGRADRVVKIGEKRLSLPDMEAELRRHPRVADAALVPLEQGGETRVGAVVVAVGPRPAGAGERRSLRGQLQEHLAARWDRVLLPRAWRFPDELPRDPQGKTPIHLLRALFAAPRSPEVVSEKRGERGGAGGGVGSFVERSCRVPLRLAHLEGHFEGFPVVPGVVQLGWAVEALRDLCGHEPEITAVEALKFQHVLGPGQAFELRVFVEGERARFELAQGGRLFASGRLRLARGASRPVASPRDPRRPPPGGAA